MSEHYTVKSLVGSFRVSKESTVDYHGNYKFDFLRIGGKNFCVEYKWNKNEPETVELQWLDVLQGGCELTNKVIRKENTVHLFDLSISILTTYVDVKFIKLQDNSKFPCELPGNKKGQIFINYYNYLFYGGTWYDTKVGAFPQNLVERESYEKNKKNAEDPSKKPEQFDFKNTDLNTMLEPLYDSTSTWREFFDVFYKTYQNDNLCGKLYPWYMSAVMYLTGGLSLPTIWLIEVSKRPTIQYEKVMTGGRRKTRKQRSYDEDEINSSELRGLKYLP